MLEQIMEHQGEITLGAAVIGISISDLIELSLGRIIDNMTSGVKGYFSSIKQNFRGNTTLGMVGVKEEDVGYSGVDRWYRQDKPVGRRGVFYYF